MKIAVKKRYLRFGSPRTGASLRRKGICSYAHLNEHAEQLGGFTIMTGHR